MSNRIPAWKRLGLKLKYANDLSNDQEHSTNHASFDRQNETEPLPERKRKPEGTSDHLTQSTPLAKKARLSNGATAMDEHPTIETTSTPKPSTKQTKRKKSVTFTSDTKVDDGDTAQTIPAVLPTSPGSTPPKPKKREKKPKSERQKFSLTQVPQKSHAAAEYLCRHYREKASWKFNKNREVWILKHISSTDDLPAELNAPLANYVHGLKSTAARERLRAVCAKAMTESASMPDVASQSDGKFRELFIRGLDRGELPSLEDDSEQFSAWIRTQPRDVVILWALGQTISKSPLDKRNINTSPKTLESNSVLNGDSTKPRVKKSKARTSRIDIDSESSSDSDDSSASSSSSDSETDDEGSDGSTSSEGTSSADSESTSSSGSD